MSTELLQYHQQQQQYQRKQQSRSVSTTSPPHNAEEPSSLAAGRPAIDDLSPIEDSSSPSSPSSAADVIQAQVDEVLSSLPLTERLFAVIQIDGKQYRVSQDDVVTVEDWLPAEMGERLRLEKVLLVGGREFSLIGRPLLRRSQVCVEATLIEKTLTATDVLRKARERVYKKTWLKRKPLSYLRINSIKLLSPN